MRLILQLPNDSEGTGTDYTQPSLVSIAIAPGTSTFDPICYQLPMMVCANKDVNIKTLIQATCIGKVQIEEVFIVLHCNCDRLTYQWFTYP